MPVNKYLSVGIKGYSAAGILALGLGLGFISGCSSGGNAGASQVMCFVSSNGGESNMPFTVQVLGTSNCSNLANELNSGTFALTENYHMTANQGSASGTQICSGTIGNYVVNAYAAKTTPVMVQELCATLGASVTP